LIKRQKQAVKNFHRTVKNALVEVIRNEIIRGKFKPGEHLRLEVLAGKFDVSTMPVREALRELESEGIVTSIAHRGSFVTSFSADELDDIYEIRANLEKLAIYSAVPRIEPRTLDELEQLVDLWSDSSLDVVELLSSNARFHNTLYAASGRSHLCGMIHRLRYRTQHYLHAYVSEPGGLSSAQDDHRHILQACRDGDAEKAGKLVYDHVQVIGKLIADSVRMQNQPTRVIAEEGVGL
jgi:DNA-binding GntR family transcriptional regulator